MVAALAVGETILEAGRPCQVTFMDLHGLLERDAGHTRVEWIVRHGKGGPTATRSSMAGGRTVTECVRMDGFAEAMSRWKGILDGSYVIGTSTLAASCRAMAGLTDWTALRDRFLIDLGRALDGMKPFLDTLDPGAMAGSVGPEHTRHRSVCYALLDLATDPDAPLAIANAMRPHFPVALRTLVRVHAKEVAAATKARDADRLDAVLRRSMTVGTGGSPAAAVMGFRVSDAMDAMTQAEREAFGQACAVWQGDLDPPYVAGRLLEGLPADWVPRRTEAWMAFAWCMPAVGDARDRCAPGMLHAMLNARGDWTGFRRRLSAAAKLPDEVGSSALKRAVTDVGDMVSAFSAQVLAPAAALSGVRAGRDALDVARALLFDGRTIRHVLEMSARWHSRQAAMLADMPPKPVGEQDRWPAGLPDARYGTFILTVLTDAGALGHEGAKHADPQGVDGLAHCVGGYAGACMSGHSRIVSIRDHASGPRVSTAEISCRDRRFSVVQHRGLANAEPGDAAKATLDAYMVDILSKRLAVDFSGLAPVTVPSGAGAAAGYDIREAGNWECVFDLWRPHVPGHLRGLPRERFAKLFGRPHEAFLANLDDVYVDIGGRGEHWHPTPFVP